jgi:L-alanine-DL-glutamate epimerase-like enolase superfamily enzyme
MELTADPLRMQDGVLALPSKPGLGVELNRDALQRFKEYAERAVRDGCLV